MVSHHHVDRMIDHKNGRPPHSWFRFPLRALMMMILMFLVAARTIPCAVAQHWTVPCQNQIYSVNASGRYVLSGLAASARCDAPQLQFVIEGSGCVDVRIEVQFATFDGIRLVCPGAAVQNLTVFVKNSILSNGSLMTQPMTFQVPTSVDAIRVDLVQSTALLVGDAMLFQLRASNLITNARLEVSGSDIRNQQPAEPLLAENFVLIRAPSLTDVIVVLTDRTRIQLFCYLTRQSSLVILSALPVGASSCVIALQNETRVSIVFAKATDPQPRYRLLYMQFYSDWKSALLLYNSAVSIMMSEEETDVDHDLSVFSEGETPGNCVALQVSLLNLRFSIAGKATVLFLDLAGAYIDYLQFSAINVTAYANVTTPRNGGGPNIAQLLFLSFKNHKVNNNTQIFLSDIHLHTTAQRSSATEQHTSALILYLSSQNSVIRVSDSSLTYTAPAPSKAGFTFADISLVHTVVSNMTQIFVTRSTATVHFTKPAQIPFPPGTSWLYLVAFLQCDQLFVMVEGCTVTTLVDPLVAPPYQYVYFGAIAMGRVNVMYGRDVSPLAPIFDPYPLNGVFVTLSTTRVTGEGALRQGTMITGYQFYSENGIQVEVRDCQLQLPNEYPAQSSIVLSSLERRVMIYLGQVRFASPSSISVVSCVGRNVGGLRVENVQSAALLSWTLSQSSMFLPMNTSIPAPRSLVIADVFESTVLISKVNLTGFTSGCTVPRSTAAGKIRLVDDCSSLWDRAPLSWKAMKLPLPAKVEGGVCWTPSLSLTATSSHPLLQRRRSTLKVVVVNGATAVAALGGVVGTSVTASALQRSLALLRIAQCSVEDVLKEPLDIASSPTRMKIVSASPTSNTATPFLSEDEGEGGDDDEASFAYLNGAIVGNALLIVGCVGLNLLSAVAVWYTMQVRRRRRTSSNDDDGCSRWSRGAKHDWAAAFNVVSFPSFGLPVLSALLPPMVSAATMILSVQGEGGGTLSFVTSDSTLPLCLVALVGTVVVGVLLWARWVVWEQVGRHATASPVRYPPKYRWNDVVGPTQQQLPHSRPISALLFLWGCLKKGSYCLMRERWRWHGRTRIHHEILVGQHGALFTPLGKGQHKGALVEWGIGILGGVLGGVLSSDHDTCTTVLSLNVVFSVVVVGWLAVARPYNVLLDGWLSLVSAVLTSAVSIAAVSRASTEVIDGLVMAQAVFSSIGMLQWVCAFLWFGGSSFSRVARLIAFLRPAQREERKERGNSTTDESDSSSEPEEPVRRRGPTTTRLTTLPIERILDPQPSHEDEQRRPRRPLLSPGSLRPAFRSRILERLIVVICEEQRRARHLEEPPQQRSMMRHASSSRRERSVN